MKNILKINTALILSLCFVNQALAATVTAGGGDTGGGIQNPLGKINSLPDLLVLIINKFVLPIGGIIVTFMLIYTGFKFVMAQGDPGELTKAKQSLVNTLIGAAIVLGALSISLIIQATINEIITAI